MTMNPINFMSMFHKTLLKGIAGVILISLSAITPTRSQITPAPPVVNIPTSPEAALLGRFGDIPVGYYTGTANISVPLYTIKLAGIEIPIVLRYHGSGIKVEDQATWVGLGWDLSPEGYITQEVRGKRDDIDNGFGSCSGYSTFRERFLPLSAGMSYPFMTVYQEGRETAFGDACAPLSPGLYADPYCIVDKLLQGYGQPDIYNYNFGGYSGKFYKHPETGQIILIDRNKQVFFEIVNSSTIKATTMDGTVWTFDVLETAEGDAMAFNYTGKTYKVGKIKSAMGRQIDFTYTTNTYHEYARIESAEVEIFSGSYTNLTSSITLHTKKTLAMIESPDTKVIFNTGSRDDINIPGSGDNLTKLSSIDIVAKENNKKIRSFEFLYGYFAYSPLAEPASYTSSSYPDVLGKRLRLDAVKEIGYTDAEVAVTNKPPFSFEYDETITMPSKVSLAKDFWGYFNGKPNTTLLPNLDYFDYLNDPEYAPFNTTYSYHHTKADRYTDNTKAGAYMLKRITYPTGGYSTFEYEPNSFTNQFIPDQSSPVYKTYDAIETSLSSSTLRIADFRLSKTTTIHLENNFKNGYGNPNSVAPLSYSDMSTCSIVLYKIIFSAGSSSPTSVTALKTWDLSTVLEADFNSNHGKTWLEDMRITYDPAMALDSRSKYQIVANFPSGLKNGLYLSSAGVTAHINYYDNTGVDVTVSNQYGLRIKSIKSYSETSILTSDKLIKYYDGKILNLFKPITVSRANYKTAAWVTEGVAHENTAFYKRETVLGAGFGAGGGSPIGYGKVEEIEREGGNETHGKRVFFYINNENKTFYNLPNSPDLQNGTLFKEQVFDASNNKLTETEYTYGRSDALPAVVDYPVVTASRIALGSQVPCATWYPGLDPAYADPYGGYFYNDITGWVGSENAFNAYAIHSEWFDLKSTLTKQYFGSLQVSDTQTFTYNSQGNTRTVTSSNSQGESMVVKYYYPNDSEVSSYVNAFLTTIHNISSPVLTERYKAGVFLNSERTEFDYFTSAGIPAPAPKYTYAKKGTASENVTVTIVSVDDVGNVTEYVTQNGIHVAIVWNANKTLPVAKIENATYAAAIAVSDYRSSLPNARVTTFTHKPLIGLATITDPNGRTEHYEYDYYGRLIWVKDHEGNIIKSYKYLYGQ